MLVPAILALKSETIHIADFSASDVRVCASHEPTIMALLHLGLYQGLPVLILYKVL